MGRPYIELSSIIIIIAWEIFRDLNMVMSVLFPRLLVFLACVVLFLPSGWAKGTEIFVCTSKDGIRTYQNVDAGSGCVPLNLNPITVVPSTRPVDTGNNMGSSGSGGGRRSNVSQDNRTAADFNAKDDRMKILQEELRIEEGKLKSLQDEYKGGQPDRLGSERNYQKYLDRVSRLEQEILVTNDNIEILKTELIRLTK
jgi:hypothetical protein